MKNKLKYALKIILFFSAIILVQTLLDKTGLPVTVLDLTLTPLCILLIYAIVKIALKNDRVNVEHYDSISLLKNTGLLITFLLMTALGLWGLISGITQPFEYFSGIKGSGHGYSLVIIGSLIILFGVFGIGFSLKVFLFKYKQSTL